MRQNEASISCACWTSEAALRKLLRKLALVSILSCRFGQLAGIDAKGGAKALTVRKATGVAANAKEDCRLRSTSLLWPRLAVRTSDWRLNAALSISAHSRLPHAP